MIIPNHYPSIHGNIQLSEFKKSKLQGAWLAMLCVSWRKKSWRISCMPSVTSVRSDGYSTTVPVSNQLLIYLSSMKNFSPSRNDHKNLHVSKVQHKCLVNLHFHWTSINKNELNKRQLANNANRWFKVTFSSPSWRSLNPWKGSLSHPKKATKNRQVYNLQ